MGLKRHRSDKASSCLGFDQDSEVCHFESDDSRASSYEDLPKRKTHRKKQKLRHAPTQSDKRPVNHNSNASLHPRSFHDMQSPDTVRAALLQWYAGVHASRGMPWRKPHDPSQGAEERAQRAYEVLILRVLPTS